VPHQFRLSYIYQIPSARALGFVGRHVLGNWDTSGILYLRDGLPFTVVPGVDNSLAGINQDRADIIGDPAMPDGRPKSEKLQQWFRTTAFAQNALGTYGTSSRNSLIGPGVINFDFSLVKAFPIRERQSLQFRTELFNVFNHANFNNPNATITAATFGRVLSAGEPRIIQFALKFVF
jgi:hypothetical protein